MNGSVARCLLRMFGICIPAPLIQVGLGKKKNLRKNANAFEQAARGSSRVTVPGGVQEACRCVGLRDMA